MTTVPNDLAPEREPPGLTNQGQPTHGDQVPYTTARAQLLGEGRSERRWVGCGGCFTPTPNVGGVCDTCLANIEVEAGRQPREQAIACTEVGCGAFTWNRDARCDDHAATERRAVAS